MNVRSFFSILKHIFKFRKEPLFLLGLFFIYRYTFYNCYSDFFFFTGSEILKAFKSILTVALGPESETTTKRGFEKEQPEKALIFRTEYPSAKKKKPKPPSCLLIQVPSSLKHMGWQRKITKGSWQNCIRYVKSVYHSALSTTLWLYPILYWEKQQPPTATKTIIRQLPFIPEKLFAT